MKAKRGKRKAVPAIVPRFLKGAVTMGVIPMLAGGCEKPRRVQPVVAYFAPPEDAMRPPPPVVAAYQVQPVVAAYAADAAVSKPPADAAAVKPIDAAVLRPPPPPVVAAMVPRDIPPPVVAAYVPRDADSAPPKKPKKK